MKKNQKWKPTTKIEVLHKRSELMRKIREFFYTRNILEVETPLISLYSGSHPEIALFTTNYITNSSKKKYYLQSSPESAMKRLLASGSGSIYQICKAFRNGDYGEINNPEFTILEWYRVGYNYHDLMNEMDLFFKEILNLNFTKKISYSDIFKNIIGLDINNITNEELINKIQLLYPEESNSLNKNILTRNDLIDILFKLSIQPKVGNDCLTYIYDFPPTQACLAKIREDKYPVAERFEAYYKGIELANGYNELIDPIEQKRRFKKDNIERKLKNFNSIPEDKYLISALKHGLPECSGVAVGIDRLMMIILDTYKISEVISFTTDNA